jgi:hypothetical protein
MLLPIVIVFLKAGVHIATNIFFNMFHQQFQDPEVLQENIQFSTM